MNTLHTQEKIKHKLLNQWQLDNGKLNLMQ